tara:strand:+ start:648 stop:1304 length:657 start_codon:yes stop_codon:yes gene_type:complete
MNIVVEQFFYISFPIVIALAFYLNSTAVLKSLYIYAETNKAATSVLSIDRRNIIARTISAIYIPFYAYYLTIIKPDFDEVLNLTIISFIFAHVICSINETIFIVKSKKIFIVDTDKRNFSLIIPITLIILDILVFSAPYLLNIISHFFFKEYAQVLVQLVVVTNGIYSVFMVWVFKRLLSEVYDSDLLNLNDIKVILYSKITVRIIFIVTLFFLWQLV